MYLVKLGDLYLASDGSFVPDQSGAQRFDTAVDADNAAVLAVVARPRRVKLRQRS